MEQNKHNEWKWLTAFVLLIFSINFSASATHFKGADMHYDCINGSNDSFLVTVTVYRDCRGIAISMINPTPGGLRLENASGSVITSQLADVTDLGVTQSCQDVTKVCRSQCTSCGIGDSCNNASFGGASPPNCNFNYGVESYVYEFLVVFDTGVTDCEIRASINGSSYRNSDISTGCANSNYYLDMVINRCQQPCNSSPRFLESPPVTVICQNRSFDYLPEIVDLDLDSSGNALDSFSIELTEPLTGFNNACSWTGGFDYQNPLQYFGFNPINPISNRLPSPRGFHLDASNGRLRFNPRATQSTVIAMKIKEFRNGQMIGYTKRDYQLIVISCDGNFPPSITAQDESKLDFKIDVCVGDTIDFTILTSDPDTPNVATNRHDSVYVTYDRGNLPSDASLSDNDFKPEKVRFPSVNLKWVPQAEHVDQSYYFTVTADDNHCPIPIEVSQVVHIKVHDAGETPDTLKVEECGFYELNGKTYHESGIYHFDTINNGGCQAQGTLDLTILERDTVEVFDSACNEYEWNNRIYQESGTYYYQTSNANNCDSVVKLHLVVDANYKTYYEKIEETACESFAMGDLVFSESGQYTYSGTSQGGCDSVIEFDLEILSSSFGEEVHKSCDEFFWNDSLYTESGIYTHILTNHLGCDSAVTLDLEIVETTSSTTIDTACNALEWNGRTYTESGLYEFITVGSEGCDSIARLSLTIVPLAVTRQPEDQWVQAGEDVNFEVESDNANTTFQWQVDEGSGFGNLSENTPFSGTDSTILTINPVSSSQDQYLFRALLSYENCMDSTEMARLNVSQTSSFGSSGSATSEVRLFPNPTTSTLTVEVGTGFIGLGFGLLDQNGKTLYSGNITEQRMELDLKNLAAGVYLLHLWTPDGREVYKVVKL